MADWWYLLAQRAAWERLGDRFQSRREVSWETWLGLLVPLLLVAVVLVISKWWMSRGAANLQHGPRALFRELAAAHRLSWYERWLLMRLAKVSRPAHPAHVFLDRSVYENPQAARQLAPVWPQILRLRAKLLGVGAKPRRS